MRKAFFIISIFLALILLFASCGGTHTPVAKTTFNPATLKPAFQITNLSPMVTFPTSPITPFTLLVGSINSDVYHYVYCVWAKKIYAENRLSFYSVAGARSHGYRPCKVCKPP